MSGFNFSSIGNVISELFDTDYIDIKREVNGNLSEVYSNVPCHVAFSSVDNPDPSSVDVKPVIQSITVHCPLYVDVQNNDFLVAKRMGADWSVLAVYSGRCGNPVVSQGRKKVSMQMNATESESPTPVPIENSVKIQISYLDDDSADVKAGEEREVSISGSFAMDAPQIDGYKCVGSAVDGERTSETSVSISDVGSESHFVEFIYEADSTPVYARFVAKGLYTKDDGTMGKGWHLYAKIPLSNVSNGGGVWTATCENVDLTHEDNGDEFKIAVGTKMALFPSGAFVRITGVSVDGGEATFEAVEYEPDDDERNAYVAEWYD